LLKAGGNAYIKEDFTRDFPIVKDRREGFNWSGFVMVAQVLVGMGMYRIFVLVAVDMDQVVRLKQGDILQDFPRFAGFYYSFILVKDINYVRYLLYDMQVVGGGDDGLTGFIRLDKQIYDVPGSQRVQPCRGFIQDKHLRVYD